MSIKVELKSHNMSIFGGRYLVADILQWVWIGASGTCLTRIETERRCMSTNIKTIHIYQSHVFLTLASRFVIIGNRWFTISNYVFIKCITKKSELSSQKYIYKIQDIKYKT